MANKKFHYNNDKRSDSLRTETDAGVRSRTEEGNPPHAVPRSWKRCTLNIPRTSCPSPVSALGVSEELVGMLALNGISTAGDLVSRTERDMFKVQGFNKKMLIALKRGLEKEGMAFYEENGAGAPASAAPRGERTRADSPTVRRKAAASPSGSGRSARRNSPSLSPSRSGERSKRAENGVFTTVSRPSSPRCTTKCSFSRTDSPLSNSTKSAGISIPKTKWSSLWSMRPR